MKPKLLLFAVLLFCLKSLPAVAQTVFPNSVFNSDLETIDRNRMLPVGWTYPKTLEDLYSFKLDSVIKQQGKYAVSITNKVNEVNYASMGFGIPKVYKGRQIELRGYLKMENVISAAGFWLRIDGTTAFDNMENRKINGTRDWTEYSIKLPYDDEKATNIAGGVILDGKGKIWFDKVRLFIDGRPIEKADIKQAVLTRAGLDTAFDHGSGISHIALNKQQIENLTLLGQVWGFLKYHHYDVAKGNINMDAELFRVMPEVLKTEDNKAVSDALEQWVDKLGVPKHCATCKTYSNKNVKISPDYGQIFKEGVLSASLREKLTDILNSRSSENYYINIKSSVANPLFEHEKSYAGMSYPDAGYRLLCLFRYWNMIQYFYPDKHLIGEDWNQVLQEFIPKFINNSNAQQYALTTLELICRIHDTHANVWGNAEIENYRGQFAPLFQAKFIGDNLVVTAYYSQSPETRSAIKIGDEITAINGETVPDLIKKYLPFTSASNYPTQLRDMPANYLLRSKNQQFDFKVKRDNIISDVKVDGALYNNINYKFNNDTALTRYHLIKGQIGYVYPANYHNSSLPAIKKMFADTRGIIIDMRCYPSDNMQSTFGSYIKKGDSEFARFTSGKIMAPGFFETSYPMHLKGDNNYKGKVVVIVNEQAQSNAEYTTMAFQSSPNVTVIGSTTAGADGNVSEIALPGGIHTLISGIGVLYPDGTETQRKGVKIDEVIHPTIAGIKAGRDELLERAEAIIMQ